MPCYPLTANHHGPGSSSLQTMGGNSEHLGWRFFLRGNDGDMSGSKIDFMFPKNVGEIWGWEERAGSFKFHGWSVIIRVIGTLCSLYSWLTPYWSWLIDVDCGWSTYSSTGKTKERWFSPMSENGLRSGSLVLGILGISPLGMVVAYPSVIKHGRNVGQTCVSMDHFPLLCLINGWYHLKTSDDTGMICDFSMDSPWCWFFDWLFFFVQLHSCMRFSPAKILATLVIQLED